MGPAVILAALFDVIAPESCAVCACRWGDRPWAPRGPSAPGLRPWDAPHLCAACLGALAAGGPVAGCTPAGLPLIGAAATGPALVAAVGAWKYHGVRGLAWPLADLMRIAIAACPLPAGAVPTLVPVPLHGRRRRQRGFNQAALLAELAGRAAGLAAADVLERQRATAQQARLEHDGDRRANLRGAMRVRRGSTAPGVPVLVDDIATSGATLDAAARALAAAGAAPAAAVVLGLRAGPG